MGSRRTWIALAAIAVAAVAVASLFLIGDRSADDEMNGSSGELTMTVDGSAVSVEWRDCASVDALKALAAEGLTVQAHRYGGFEQVGSLGKRIVSEDRRETSSPGDIFLYGSDSIVLFYGSNSWDYTPLGRISGMSDEGIRALLDKPGVAIGLSVQRYRAGGMV